MGSIFGFGSAINNLSSNQNENVSQQQSIPRQRGRPGRKKKLQMPNIMTKIEIESQAENNVSETFSLMSKDENSFTQMTD